MNLTNENSKRGGSMDIDPIRPSTLRELAATEQARCVSLFMPTHTAGSGSRQDPIRLANLLDEVHEQLKLQGMRRPDIESFLQPARQVVDQSSFWQFQGTSLAVYLAEGTSRMLRLPEALDESVTLGPHFNIKPIIGSLASSEPFYVLALTKDQARLFYGTRSDFEEVHTDQFPVSIEEIAGVREGETQLHHHSGLAPRGGRGDRGHRGDMGQSDYHGHGEGELKIESDVLHYLKSVAERVADYLYGDDAPLVLAANVSLVGLYHREHLGGRLVKSDHVESPDASPEHVLHQQAWKIVAPYLEADRVSLLERFGTAAANGKAAQGYGEVAQAAAQGRIDTLFFDPRATQLGWLSEHGTTVQMVDSKHEVQTAEIQPEDLVNLAILETLKTGGRAIPLAAARGREERNAVPQPPKAILRY
jgi:hypothetical protein